MLRVPSGACTIALGMLLGLLGACGSPPAASSPRNASDEFTHLPRDGKTCLLVRPGVASPRQRSILQGFSRAADIAWEPGVVSWAQVGLDQAWRAEATLSIPAEEFIEAVHAIHVSEPWRDICTGDCATPRIWILGPRRVGAGAHFWHHFDHEPMRCEVDRDGKIVEQGRTRDGARRQMHATQQHVLIAREVRNPINVPLPGFRHEHFDERLWNVRRFRGDDAELRAQDERYRREAMLQLAQAQRPIPVDRIRMDDWDSIHEQLALWSEEAATRGEPAERELARLVGRVAAAHHEGRSLLIACARACLDHGCGADVLPWLDAHLTETRGNDRLRLLRRRAARVGAPQRFPALLEEDGVTENGALAAAMLMDAEPYEAAEAAWRAHEALPSPRLRRSTGRLPLATLVETLVALLDVSGNPLRAVYVRMDTASLTPPPPLQPPFLRVSWPQGEGGRQMLLVPLTHDVSDAPALFQDLEGSATISVGIGDEDGPTESLTLHGRFEADLFVIEAASRAYDWDVVSRLLAEPLGRLSRRLFPPPNFTFEASANEQALFEERARADEGIACASGREGGTVFECAVSPERMSTRRSMVEVVRPALVPRARRRRGPRDP
ncbi:MAG: hypothetical protein AB8H86_09860 [Polyangiales bacterium]